VASQAWRAEQEIAEHQLVPLAAIERAAGGPLFDTFFNYTKFDPGGWPARSWACQDLPPDAPVDVAFGLATDFQVEPATGALRLTLQYDGRRLGEESIEALAGGYRGLLASLAAGPPARNWHPPLSPVTTVWRELTGADPSSAEAGFTSSGGSSLLALRFVAMLRDQFGITVDLRAFRADDRFASALRLAGAAPAGRGSEELPE
jgi:hypothetical protein